MSAGDEYYDLSPDKRTLRSLQSDVTPITAVEELVDNVLDNWRRPTGASDDITIDIDIDFDNERFRIEDDSGGLSEEEVKQIFALGGSTQSTVPNSIGSYGMGAKKAILRLGSRAEIKSRSVGADSAYGFSIDEEWLRSENWQVEKQTFDSVDEGTTVIEISGLDIQFQSQDSEEATDSEDTASRRGETTEASAKDNDARSDGASFKTPSEYLGSLRDELAETYDEFLRGRAGPKDGNVTIVVNGKRVKPEPGVDWAFTPFDGYHPRWFKQYQIPPDDLPDRDEPVHVDIIAGLTRGGKEAEAGTDIIIQNRRILTSETGQMGGWGWKLPSFNAQRTRTRFKVKISVENNPETLPWDTQKSRIEPNSVITDKVFNVLQRAGGEYARITYDNFPTPYTKPFDDTSVISDPDGEWEGMEPFDYSDRSLFTDTPDSDRPLASQIGELVDHHRDSLRIYAPHIVAEPYQRAYREAFYPNEDGVSSDFTPDDDNLWIVPEEGQEYPEQELHLILETVRDQAELHRRDGTRLQLSNDPWWGEYYEQVQHEDGTSLSDLEVREDDSQIADLVEQKGETRDLPDAILQTDILRPDDLQRIFSDEARLERDSGKQLKLEDAADSTSSEVEIQEEGPTKETDDDEDSIANASESRTTQSSETGEASDTESDNGGRSEAEGVNTSSEGSEDGSEPLDFGTSNSRSGQTKLTGKQPVTFMLSNHEYERLCAEIELDSTEARGHEVAEAVVANDIDIREYINGE